MYVLSIKISLSYPVSLQSVRVPHIPNASVYDNYFFVSSRSVGGVQVSQVGAVDARGDACDNSAYTSLNKLPSTSLSRLKYMCSAL